MDVKLGRATSYPWAPPELRAKCERKDASTTQRALGLRLCGVRCERLVGGDGCSAPVAVWSKDRHWGKALAGADDVRAALRRFAALGDDEEPAAAGSEGGLLWSWRQRRRRRRLAALAAEVGRLRACVAQLPHVRLFSASVLLLLEEAEEEEQRGDGGEGEGEGEGEGDDDDRRRQCRARVALVDFAHAFVRPSSSLFEGPDDSVLAGLDALRQALLLGAAAQAGSAAAATTGAE